MVLRISAPASSRAIIDPAIAGLPGARYRIQDKVELFAVRVVYAAYAVNLAGLDLGSGHQRQKWALFLGANQGETTDRVAEQMLRGALDVGKLCPGAEQEY